MNGTWGQLAGNIAFVGLVISIWAHTIVWFRRLVTGYEKFLFGTLFAVAAIGSVSLAVEISSGTFVDLGYATIIIATLFGGRVGTIAAFVTAIFHLCFHGADHEAIVIAVVACVGTWANFLLRNRSPCLLDVVLTSVAVGATLAMSRLILMVAMIDDFASADLFALALNCAAIVVFGFVVLKTEQSQLERSILVTAFSQSPDYLYVKDRDSRFVTVNKNMVRLHRRATTDEMVGLSDFDTMPRNLAEELYNHEQEVMRTGTPLVDSFEQMEERYFLASKVPVRNAEGSVIGLAGVTRDITECTALERELRESKDLLAHAMEGMSDGFAMFDGKGFLLFCNEQYRNAFPLSADARVVGANIRDILHRVVETRERSDIPYDAAENWIEAASATLHRNKDEEIQLPNGDWRSLKTRLAGDGTATVVVSDITAMKQSENALRLLAGRMKSLAETDCLTGIVNRRAFDEAFAREAGRSADNNTPLSLLMIDVDRFKAYNDTYGHPAGDQCLRVISTSLLRSVRRPTDIVARYGGEEFVVLLPETSQCEAEAVAKRFTHYLDQEGIVHAGSEHGRVTASVGIASAAGRIFLTEPSCLLTAADCALYDAKAQGRNRIVFTSLPTGKRPAHSNTI